MEEAEGNNSQSEEQVEPEASQQSKGNKKKGRPKGAATNPEFPCLCCGENCTKSQQSVQCVMCSLWGHKSCLKMTDTVFKALEAQLKDSGTAYYVCRPCQKFAQRVQHQLCETNKKQQETDRKVQENTDKIQDNAQEIEKLRQELKKLSEKNRERPGEPRKQTVRGNARERSEKTQPNLAWSRGATREHESKQGKDGEG